MADSPESLQQVVPGSMWTCSSSTWTMFSTGVAPGPQTLTRIRLPRNPSCGVLSGAASSVLSDLSR